MPIAHIIATYNTYTHFQIPKSLRDFLLSKEECDSLLPNCKKPGYWYIYWDTLHYYDANGEEKEIKSNGEDTAYKHPTEIETLDEPVFNDSDTEEDSDDEQEDEEEESGEESDTE